jgi:N-acetyl-gamma-glutamyl-phosphate reductase
MNIYSAAIVGVTGYSGREAERLLARHPSVRVAGRFASKGDGAGLEAGLRVIDMSGAFRLKDASLYPAWYGFEHTSPSLLQEAVYGMTDLFAEKVRKARLVANPGCYATSVIVPLAPLYEAGVIGKDSLVVADGKSGVSGAGRHPKQETHFCEVNENLRAYGVLKHRHTPEMLACLPGASTQSFVFTPHLIPITRGILTTIVFQHADGYSARAVLADRYSNSQFVKLFAEGTLPDIHGVVNTNGCHLGVVVSGRNTVVVSAIDNLVKGAAVENLNLMLGLPAETGLVR